MELASQRRVLFVNEEKSRVGACSNSHERQGYLVEKKKKARYIGALCHSVYTKW